MNNNEYHRVYNNKRYRKIRLYIIEKLGGKCTKCGSVKNLEVDHIDPSIKSFDSKMWLTVTNQKREEEFGKCQLLCKECHVIKTIRESGKQIARGTHGTLSSYRYCKCEECRNAKSTYMKNYMKTYIRKRNRLG